MEQRFRDLLLASKLSAVYFIVFVALFGSTLGGVVWQGVWGDREQYDAFEYVLRYGSTAAILSTNLAVAFVITVEGGRILTMVLAKRWLKQEHEKGRQEGAKAESEKWQKWYEEVKEKLNGEIPDPPER